MSRPAVVLLSGGLDSTTLLAMAQAQGFELHALSFRYGQRHAMELVAAQRIAEAFGMSERHHVLNIDVGLFQRSALTDRSLAVPKARTEAEMGAGIPITYVPARNTVFLSLALAWSEVLGASDIFIGVNALDYSGYPDCRPEYIQAYEQMANLATRSAVEENSRIRIRTPLMTMSKAEIIMAGTALGVDYALTLSCYDPQEDGALACGQCDACLLRIKGFAEAGIRDPIAYVVTQSRMSGR